MEIKMSASLLMKVVFGGGGVGMHLLGVEPTQGKVTLVRDCCFEDCMGLGQRSKGTKTVASSLICQPPMKRRGPRVLPHPHLTRASVRCPCNVAPPQGKRAARGCVPSPYHYHVISLLF